MNAAKRPHVPSEVGAEQCVIGAAFLQPDQVLAAVKLEPDDFFDKRHQFIWSAMRRLARHGHPANDPFLLERELGEAAKVVDVAYMSECTSRVPTADNVGHYADIVRDAAITRRVQVALSEVLNSGLEGAALMRAAAERVSTLASAHATHRDGIDWISTSDIFEPLPPTPWLVRDLLICPGRPCMIAGYGYAGKTLISQALLLAVAAGAEAWGHFATGVPQRVRHLDFEQGQHASRKRYQRLLLGMDLHTEQIGDRLELAVFPDANLNEADALDAYCRISDGCAMVLLDSLRGATPGEDENDSQIASCLHVLARASEKTGASFVVDHHAGKPKEGHKDGRTLARGSSAIFDACGSVFTLTGEKGKPTLVTQVKAPAEAEGGAVDDFHLAIEDVPLGMNDRAGVRVVHQAVALAAGRDKAAKFEAIKDEVVECVRGTRGLSTATSITERVEGRKGTVLEAIRELEVDGAIRKIGGEYRLAEGDR